MDLLPFAIGGVVLADWSPVSVFTVKLNVRLSFVFVLPRVVLENVSHETVLGDFSYHVGLLCFCLIRTLALGK